MKRMWHMKNNLVCTLYNIYLTHFILQNGWTALMRASDSGFTDVVRELLSGGAQIDLQDEVRHSIN